MPPQSFDLTQVLNSQMLTISATLHQLVEQFDRDQANLDMSWLSAMKAQLQHIGWNALFTSSTIDTLLQILPANAGVGVAQDPAMFQKHIDDLSLALKYFSENVRALRIGKDGDLPVEQAGKLEQFVEKLVEVADECR